jgi:hypothetical protein
MTSLAKFEGHSQPEKQNEILDDNARKFIIESLDSGFPEANGASAFLLTTDWLETGHDNEKKLAYKKFPNSATQILLISKITKNGHRTSEKEKISEEEYAKLINGSVRRLEKMRYEFEYIQNETTFDIKYDEFIDSQLRVLEVDAPTEEERNSFKPNDFPGKLSEVTGMIQYYGYRVADIV